MLYYIIYTNYDYIGIISIMTGHFVLFSI